MEKKKKRVLSPSTSQPGRQLKVCVNSEEVKLKTKSQH